MEYEKPARRHALWAGAGKMIRKKLAGALMARRAKRRRRIYFLDRCAVGAGCVEFAGRQIVLPGAK